MACADVVHAHTEQFRSWSSLEADIFRRRSVWNSDVTLSLEHRTLALHVIKRVMVDAAVLAGPLMAARSDACWFEAVQLFDLTSGDMAQVTPQRIVTRAIAVWMVTLKLSTSDVRKLSHEHTSHYALLASAVSTQLGGPAVSWQDVLREECGLLSSGARILRMPSVRSWLPTCIRCCECAMGRELGEASRAEALRLTTLWVGLIVRTAPSCPTSPSSRVASSTTCLALAAIGAIPADIVRPAGADEGRWRATLADVSAASQLHGDSTLGLSSQRAYGDDAQQLAAAGGRACSGADDGALLVGLESALGYCPGGLPASAADALTALAMGLAPQTPLFWLEASRLDHSPASSI